MTISNNKIVSVTYDLYVGDDKPELMEQATGENPLTFLYGIGMMLEKFEANLAGLKKDDEFDFTIECKDAYGEYDDESVLELAKNLFEIDGKFDAEVVKEGNVVPLMDTDGNRFNAMVVSVADSTVTVDLNHPLSGENLHFVGKVIEVREATEEEIAAATRPHCGGNCGNCGGGCGGDKECDGERKCGGNNDCSCKK